MKDECTAFEPIANTLHMLSISSLEILRNMLEMEIASRRSMFYDVEAKTINIPLRSVK